MSEIALYNLLKRIPDTTDEQVKEVVADIANCVLKLLILMTLGDNDCALNPSAQFNIE